MLINYNVGIHKSGANKHMTTLFYLRQLIKIKLMYLGKELISDSVGIHGASNTAYLEQKLINDHVVLRRR